jgi:hypothetical protein
VDAPPFTLHGALVLDAGFTDVPDGEVLAREASGALHVLRRNSAAKTLYRPDGAGGHEAHALGTDWPTFFPPFLALDPDGHPHVLYAPPVPAGGDSTRTAHHVWHDGTVWHDETLTLEPSSDFSAVFAAGPGGAVHLVYVREAAGGGTERVHAVRADGAWTRTVLPAAALPFPTYALHAAADGSVVLAVASYWGAAPAIALYTRPPTGSWTVEWVPGVEPFRATWLVAGDRGRAGLLVRRTPWVGGAPQEQFWYLARDAGGWAAPVLVATAPFVGMDLGASAAMSADGARVLLAVDLPDAQEQRHTELLVRQPEGGFRRQRIGPAGGASVSFDGAGRAVVLAPRFPGIGVPDVQRVAVFAER